MREILFFLLCFWISSIFGAEPGRFLKTSVAGDEIITDWKTGLKWTKGISIRKNFDSAQLYCQNLTYAGSSNWRLPDIYQLRTLINRKKYNPASDFPEIVPEWYWSLTKGSNNHYAVCVNFETGEIYPNPANSTNAIFFLCVSD